MTRLRSCELSLGVGVRTGMGAADLTQSFLESLFLRPRARSHIDAAENDSINLLTNEFGPLIDCERKN